MLYSFCLEQFALYDESVLATEETFATSDVSTPPWAGLGRKVTLQKGASLTTCFYGPTCITAFIAITFSVKFIYFILEEQYIRCSCKSLS